MVGDGGSSAGSYLADPTSPIPSHCAVIILFKSVQCINCRDWHRKSFNYSFVLHRSENRTWINSLRWSALVGLEPAYTRMWVASSTTVMWTLTWVGYPFIKNVEWCTKKSTQSVHTSTKTAHSLDSWFGMESQHGDSNYTKTLPTCFLYHCISWKLYVVSLFCEFTIATYNTFSKTITGDFMSL